MALDYSLRIATDWSAARVARLVRETAQAYDMVGSSSRLDVVGKSDSTASGMGIWVVDRRTLGPRVYGDPIVTELGLPPPTVAVVFSVYKGCKWGDIVAQEDDMVRIVVGVLAAVPGDAFLDSDYEVLWLVRRGDDLSLHEDDRIWTTERLLMIMQPFRRATTEIP